MAIFSKLKLPSGEIRDIAAKFDADGNEIKTTYAKKSDVPTGGDADTVNGHTVESDVPANAVFTDTTYDAATAAPKMDEVGAVGSSTKYAREDHVHPSDTSRVPITRKINNKSLSSDITLDAADVKAIPSSQKGVASGVAELDSTGKVPSSQLPSYVDDVLEYSAKSEFPLTGETGKIYIDTSSDITYRWSGSAYAAIGSSLALGETSSTAYRGDRGAAAYTHAVTNKGSEFASGFYKIGTNSEGHVTSATAVAKSDITALGIPGSLVGTAYEYDDTSLTLEFNEETEFDASFSPISDLEIDQIMSN